MFLEAKSVNVVFLGTGAGMPAKSRNVSSIALQLLEERKAVWLFDCGEATQHQILHTNVKPGKIEKIFITHLHGDHIFGLPGLISSRSFQGGTGVLTIYGPKGIEEFVRTSLSVSCSRLNYELQFVEVTEGIIFEDDLFYVTAAALEHGVDSYGYRVVEKDLPGELNAEELKRLGVKPGPVFRKLKNGETVQLEDGRVLNGPDFVGPPKEGRIVTILGDTRLCEGSLRLAKDCDYLIHEATFSADSEDMAFEYYHSTTAQAATVAKEAGAKRLLLTHISSRYTGEDVRQLLQEARAIFPETLIAEDLLTVEITKQ